VTSHGNYPVWRKDGREIVYLDEYQGRNYIWSVPVALCEANFVQVLRRPYFPLAFPLPPLGI
jgi:hypothetical protein